MDDPFSRLRAAFEAELARHRAEIERAIAAHRRAMESMDRRITEAMRRRERSNEAIERRIREAVRNGRPGKPPRGRKRRDEGGEPAPVVPRPKPSPLTGAAAAPIE